MRMIRDSIPSKSMLVAGVVATLVSVALAGIAFATPPSGATAPVGNGARGLRASSPATADTVVEWNLNAARAIFVTAGQPPQQSVPHLAMVHGAVYDAVNAIDGGHEGYLISSRLATSSDSKEAAAATAAYRVLLNIVPAQQSVLDAQYAASLAAIPDSVSKTRGIAVGEAAAAAMIAARTADGRFGPFRFAVGTAPGVWRPVLPAFVNDPNAWLKDVKPFLIQSSSQFRSKGPLALTSRRYAREFAEVKSLGSDTSTTRTADQTLAARYWAENPPATWSRIFRTLSAQQGLSIVENARLFAMLYMSGADALISVWDDKAHFPFWRPITAIREADTDGNSATAPDPAWLPLIPNPPYPEHPSGHTGLSGSIVATLRQFFRTDKMAWTDTNNAGLTRSFTRFSQAIDEIIDARVWSGIHFRTADQQGARIGRQVAKWRHRHFFRPAKK
jgi:PAP2 superfamily